jgi:glyoxylase-like metal-dependent hydrolase (beta-lactamase superfamily II)
MRRKTWVTKSGYRVIQLLSGRSNVFLLTNERANILIDTGVKFMRGVLESSFSEMKISHIDYLILTHTHFDHVANADWIKKKYGAAVIVHRSEAPYLASGKGFLPAGTNPFTKILISIAAKKVLTIIKCEPCQYDILVDSWFSLNIFGFNAYIMHTPGHSPGSISVIVDDEIALVGDTIVGTFKWTLFPPFGDDVNQLLKSWEKLLDTKCSLFIPAHGTANNRSLLVRDLAVHKNKLER